MVGTIIGNYQIIKKIGEGGMGAVYQGMDLMLERAVAIKVLRAELTDDPHIVERFRREAKALAKLNHPNITSVYNFFVHNDEYLIVLEFVDGENLEQRLAREGKIAYGSVHGIFAQITSALAFAHHQGIVHRDIKPANIMQTADGAIKVTDFGIARILGAKALTQIGKAPGSVYYASPEQIHASENLDARSDIYSLGILLFQILSGTLPFRGASLPEILQKQLDVPAPAISGYLPAVSPVVEAVIKKALAKNPADRFQSVEDFFRALPPAALVDAKGDSSAAELRAAVSSKSTARASVPPAQPARVSFGENPPSQTAAATKAAPNHIRLTDSRFTVKLEPQLQSLPAAKPRRKNSRRGKLTFILVIVILLFGLSAFAVFHFLVQPHLNSFR